MKILVTGANGFIGKNLFAELRNKGYNDIFEFTRTSNPSLLEKYTKECDFVFHLAGVNRPKDEREYMEGNLGLTSKLVELLKKHGNKAPVLLTSSIQAEVDNPYGKSKKAGEDLLFDYSYETDTKVFVYRLPNLFGKWSKPNYNTVVATFCHNIARDIEIQVNNPDVDLTISYVDDVLDEFLRALNGKPTLQENYCVVPVTYKIKLGKLAEIIMSFKKSRTNLSIPNMKDDLTKKLYSTYLSFLPEDQFSYNLKMNCDNRGSFTEFIKTPERGQVSVNISKPGITRGNHWHHTKNEKFLVVSGKGVIRFRKIGSSEIIEYYVSGEEMEVIDIPVGYVHNITNIGDEDLITLIWANEIYDPQAPDTMSSEV